MKKQKRKVFFSIGSENTHNEKKVSPGRFTKQTRGLKAKIL